MGHSSTNTVIGSISGLAIESLTNLFIDLLLSCYGVFAVIYCICFSNNDGITNDIAGYWKNVGNVHGFVMEKTFGNNKIGYYKLYPGDTITILVQGGADTFRTSTFNRIIESRSHCNETIAIFEIDGYTILSDTNTIPDQVSNLANLILYATRKYNNVNFICHSYGGSLTLFTLSYTQILSDKNVSIETWHSPYDIAEEFNNPSTKYYAHYSFYNLIFRNAQKNKCKRAMILFKNNTISLLTNRAVKHNNFVLPYHFKITMVYSEIDAIVKTSKKLCDYIKSNHANTTIIKNNKLGHLDLMGAVPAPITPQRGWRSAHDN
jgi:hypothetical protein